MRGDCLVFIRLEIQQELKLLLSLPDTNRGRKLGSQLSWTDIPSWSLETAKSIMEAVRMKDADTYWHCVRVSGECRLLAKAAGLNEIDQRVAEFAGLFHDIGKIGIPDKILKKPSKLTDKEMKVMQDHPELSVQILEPLSQLEFYKLLIPGVRYHHEWFDGRGYPHGVKGEDIPLAARIVLIADTFDAMTVSRAYRKGRSAEIAYKELTDYSGRQFDPQLVKTYLEAKPGWGNAEKLVLKEMHQTVLKSAA
jgi:HD-GYP domain-containing protein (c-di-GMP phosphodiesterase class II)